VDGALKISWEEEEDEAANQAGMKLKPDELLLGLARAWLAFIYTDRQRRPGAAG
jgi:hypothetical protein